MDRLWAPWRMKYIQGIGHEDEGCIFCSKPTQDRDRDNLILHKDEKCFVIMNLYPYNNCHLLVVPRRHTSSLSDIDRETLVAVWEMVGKSVEILTKEIHADGFNIGLNLGRTAGAGIDQHLHVHIVPRWNGDTNFMPVTAETKIISQGLHDAYDALIPHFRDIAGIA
jgi:ATP adenylyltransferase